jgi:hypothetical protein
MVLVHDAPEAIAGDVTPSDGVSPGNDVLPRRPPAGVANDS